MKRANLTVPEKLKMQREGYEFFCVYHESDRCAIGEDIGFVCFHASKHKTREGCQYWKPVHIKREDEITRLRAALADVTEERDRMREALKRIDGMATTICMRADAGYGMTVETVMPIYETARAAIEGVKEPATGSGNNGNK